MLYLIITIFNGQSLAVSAQLAAYMAFLNMGARAFPGEKKKKKEASLQAAHTSA